MFEYDKSGKWYIQHHGDSILRIFGVRDIASWTAAQAELVLPRQLPDGVLRVLERGRTEPDIYILEIATYPDARVPSQAVRDAALGFLERNVLPEVPGAVPAREGERAGGRLDRVAEPQGIHDDAGVVAGGEAVGAAGRGAARPRGRGALALGAAGEASRGRPSRS